MKLRVKCFVSDKDGNLINSHTFYSDDEKILYAEVNGFNFAMSRYGKDYTVKNTPILDNTFELNKEEDE